MSNGSREPETPKDVQCEHCGRYYRHDGIHGHEPNCPLKGEDVTIVPIVGSEDPSGPVTPGARTPDEPDDGEDAGGRTPIAEVRDGGELTPPAPDLEDSELVDEPADAATDGGRTELPTPDLEPDRSDDPPVSIANDESDEECPSCGTTDTLPIDDLVDELPDRFVAAAGLQRHARFCPDCTEATDSGIQTEAW